MMIRVVCDKCGTMSKSINTPEQTSYCPLFWIKKGDQDFCPKCAKHLEETEELVLKKLRDYKKYKVYCGRNRTT